MQQMSANQPLLPAWSSQKPSGGCETTQRESVRRTCKCEAATFVACCTNDVGLWHNRPVRCQRPSRRSAEQSFYCWSGSRGWDREGTRGKTEGVIVTVSAAGSRSAITASRLLLSSCWGSEPGMEETQGNRSKMPQRCDPQHIAEKTTACLLSGSRKRWENKEMLSFMAFTWMLWRRKGRRAFRLLPSTNSSWEHLLVFLPAVMTG